MTPEKIPLMIEEMHSLNSTYISTIYIDYPHWVQVASLVQIKKSGLLSTKTQVFLHLFHDTMLDSQYVSIVFLENYLSNS